MSDAVCLAPVGHVPQRRGEDLSAHRFQTQLSTWERRDGGRGQCGRAAAPNNWACPSIWLGSRTCHIERALGLYRVETSHVISAPRRPIDE